MLLVGMQSGAAALENGLAIFFFLSLFILREREKESMQGRGRERGENLKQAPHCQHRAQRGARSHKPWDHDLNRNQESDA